MSTKQDASDLRIPGQSSQDLARAEGRPIARLEDPSTHVGLPEDQCLAVDAAVDEAELLPTMRRYLKAFARTGYKNKACVFAGVTNQNPPLWRRHESYGQAFSALESIVQEALVERLEESVDVRAFLGYLEPVFGALGRPEIEEREVAGDEKGAVVKEVVHRFTGIVGYKRMFDAQLAQFRLKALAPEKYAERRKTELSGPGGGPITIAPVVDRLSGQLERMLKARDEETVEAEK